MTLNPKCDLDIKFYVTFTLIPIIRLNPVCDIEIKPYM